MNDSPFPAPRRLSLAEILIAVTIGGLLLSVLVPAFKSASEDADLARCRSNLHEIGAAMHLYAADHDGRLPAVTDNNLMFYTLVNVSTLPGGTVARGVGALVGPPDGYGDNRGYLKSWLPLFCPSQIPYPVPEPGVRPNHIGYLGVLVRPETASTWWTNNNWTNESIHSNPLMPVIYDFGQQGAWPVGHIITIPSHPTVSEDPNKRTGLINVLHVGGHVSTRSLEEADMHTTLGALMRYLGTGEVRNSL